MMNILCGFVSKMFAELNESSLLQSIANRKVLMNKTWSNNIYEKVVSNFKMIIFRFRIVSDSIKTVNIVFKSVNISLIKPIRNWHPWKWWPQLYKKQYLRSYHIILIKEILCVWRFDGCLINLKTFWFDTRGSQTIRPRQIRFWVLDY